MLCKVKAQAYVRPVAPVKAQGLPETRQGAACQGPGKTDLRHGGKAMKIFLIGYIH
jgi:hypothetical protein